MDKQADVPSLGVLVTGGIGVLVVVAFVAAVVLGRSERVATGDRVAVAPSAEPGMLPAVFVGRCADERVRSVQVRIPDGPVLWRVESDKGTIDRAFVIGGTPPAFFATAVALRDGVLPSGTLDAVVQVDDVVDHELFDVASLEPGEGSVGVSCGERSLGLVAVVFILGAIGVAAAYASMVLRFLRR
jgi:hypothetical protein